MAVANKHTDRAWIWPVYPVADRSRPPNILIDSSSVQPGRDVVMEDPSSRDRICKYVIPGHENKTRSNSFRYYRPTLSELKVVEQLLEIGRAHV